MGEDLLKQFRFSLMVPSDFSDVVMPTEILFLTEVIDVFKQFTSVSIPGGFKFSLSPRKTVAEPLFSFNTGEVQIPDREASGATSDVSNKTGLFTFAVKRDIALRGVVIVTNKDQESYQVSLSITQRGKKIKQIKSKTFMCKETLDSDNHGEVIVVFNRPMNLLKNTCFTIETETQLPQTIVIVPLFVKRSSDSDQLPPRPRWLGLISAWARLVYSATHPPLLRSAHLLGSTSLVFPLLYVAKAINSSPSEKIDKYDVVSCCSFGKCHLKCPDHSKYSGEIIQLLFKE